MNSKNAFKEGLKYNIWEQSLPEFSLLKKYYCLYERFAPTTDSNIMFQNSLLVSWSKI